MTGQNPVFIPRPTNIPDLLRHAMSIQTIDHRSSDFGELLSPLLSDLKKVFRTTFGQVFTFPASGIGGWEAAIINTLSPGAKEGDDPGGKHRRSCRNQGVTCSKDAATRSGSRPPRLRPLFLPATRLATRGPEATPPTNRECHVR